MSPDNDRPRDEDEDDGDERPIEVLRALAVAPAPGFMARLRARIERRSLTSQVVAVSWHLPMLVLWEFVQMAFGLLGSRSDREGDSP